ncbi:MAG: hypothetical protein K2K70_10035 [Lachnospiraceae bacterium]|nr:hypothetical protein [Lachnospiraceae bacterium]
MGFFDKWKKKEKSDSNISHYRTIVDLFEVDVDTRTLLEQCIENPSGFYQEHADQYEERGLEESDDDDTIIWLGMMDAFIEAGKLFEFDYNVELDDFIYGMGEIIPGNSLRIDENQLDEDSDITEWTKILSEQWSDEDYVIAAMDIDSDSYCIFIPTREVFDKLVMEAEKTGHRIDLAQNL